MRNPRIIIANDTIVENTWNTKNKIEFEFNLLHSEFALR